MPCLPNSFAREPTMLRCLTPDYEPLRGGATVLPATVRSVAPDSFTHTLILAEGAVQTVKRIPEGDLGTVVVGFTAASAHVVLPRLLGVVREKLPDVKLT